MQFHIAGTFEFFEDYLVHLRSGLDQSRGEDCETTPVLDITGSPEETLGLLKCIRIHTPGEHLAGSRLNGIVGTRQTRDGVEHDDDVVATFYHTFRLVEHNLGDLDVAFCRLIESRSDDFGIDAASHIGNFLGTFVNQQDNHIDLRMVRRDSIRYILEQNRLTGFRRSHDQTTLSLAYRREKIHEADSSSIVHLCGTTFTKHELLVGEERGKMFEGDAVADFLRRATVNPVHLNQREILLALFRGTNGTLHNISGLESEELYLRLGDVNIIGRRKVVVVRGTEEAVAVGHHL